MTNIKQESNDIAVGIEKNYGTPAMLKLAISSLCKTLVEAGVIHEERLCVNFIDAARDFIEATPKSELGK